MKALIVINEQHQLLPDQERVLLERFDSFERVNVPAEGWTLDEIRAQAETLWSRISECAIVFASPIPALLAILANWDGQTAALASLETQENQDGTAKQSVFVLHNDRRDKKELPGGKVIATVAAEGWQLI